MSLILGMDPGASTGLAHFLDGKLVHLDTITPVQIERTIRETMPARVVFEDSRLETRAWNARAKGAYGAALATARSLGQVDAWCSLITAVCAELGIPAGVAVPADTLALYRNTSPSRSQPIGSIDAGLFFDRNTRWRGEDYLHTLEPRLFYLNSPFRDQSALPLFDTTPLTFGWGQLFRDNRYSGADRQADANQATLAITSRLLDGEDGRERLSLSLGRVLYLDTPRVRLPGEPLPEGGGSAYVGEADWRVSDRWSLSLAQQWHPGSRGTELSALRSQWRFADRGVLNASYRYRKDLLEQADLSFTAPIDAHWRTVGRWVWSLRERRTLEALGGVEWRSCCMAVRVLARDYIRDLNAERNLGIYVEIELNGLGRFGRDSERLLSDGILGYTP